MKKFYGYKFIQLICYILYIAIIAKFVLEITGVSSFESESISVERGYLILLVTGLIFFIGIVVDIFFIKKIHIEQQSLDKLTYLDPVTGGLNRYSCDLLLQSYDTPEIKRDLGCFLFTPTNLRSINAQNGREAGNQLLKTFNQLLEKVVGRNGIVARNAPEYFLVVLKNCSEIQAKDFIKRVESAAAEYNEEESDLSIEYAYSMSLNCIENKQTISELIAQAQQQIK